MANYVRFDQLKPLVQEIGHKFKLAASAYTVKGNATLATLPAPSAKNAGFVFNMTAEFTTTADFVEGAGQKYPAGTNVSIVDATPITYSAVAEPAADVNPKYNGWYEKDTSQDVYYLTADTEVASGKTYYTGVAGTAAYKYDVIAGFIDVDGIEQEIATGIANFAPAFTTTDAYAIGDMVVYNGTLYKFKAAHTAGVWDGTEADVVTVEDLINAIADAIEPLSSAQETELIGLLG